MGVAVAPAYPIAQVGGQSNPTGSPICEDLLCLRPVYEKLGNYHLRHFQDFLVPTDSYYECASQLRRGGIVTS
jgi:hypothetical protein